MSVKIRWDKIARKNVESPAVVEAFLDEYEALCRKHELCLSHEDGHGSFIIERLRNSQIKWVRNAALGMLRGIQRGIKRGDKEVP